MLTLRRSLRPARHYRSGLGEHSIALFGTHEVSANRVAQHLFGVGQIKLTHPAGGADQIDDRVGNGAAKDLGDARQDLHQ